MADITAQMVKELRDRSGVGMSKCKEALIEAQGDIDAAIAYLRKTGMATAVKKESRETKEGLITASENDDVIAFVEVSAETDFVTKSDNFQNFMTSIAHEIAVTRPATLEAFAAQRYSGDSSMTIDEYRSTMVQSIGENIQIKRYTLVEKKPNFSLGMYSHMGGKICALVEIEGAEGEQDLAKDIAMHVAAEAPEYLLDSEVPDDVKNSERDIAREQVKGKPANIMEKIVEGKLKAFYNRVCLLDQHFIKDSDLTIAQVVEKRSNEIKKPLKIKSFLRWSVI